MTDDDAGMVRCALGHRHWGRYGAAGLLVHVPDRQLVLLQLRSQYSQLGGMWGIPGGALHRGESAVDAALAETEEETTLDTDLVAIEDEFVRDCGGWTYTTVLATIRRPVAVTAASAETAAVRWVPTGHVIRLRLHPGFASSWPQLLRRLRC